MTGINISGVGVIAPSGDVQAIHLLTNTGAQSIYAQKDISPLGALWVGCDIKWLADLPSTGEFTGVPVGLDDGVTGIAGAGGWYAQGTSGPALNTYFATNGPFAGVALSTWYHVDYYWERTPVVEELWVDEADQGVTTAGSPWSDDIVSVQFGMVFPGGWETNYELYLAAPTIGTSRGGSEVFSTPLVDFSDFDATDAGDGTLEIVTVPGP